MNQFEKPSEPDKDLLVFAIKAVAVVFVVAFVAIAVYMYKFNNFILSGDQEVWGQAGDFFGGIINPVVGLVTVILVLITVILQRKELRNSIKEMRDSNAALVAQNQAIALQSFEQTFFAWLSSYRDLVSSVTGSERSLDIGSRTTLDMKGRGALYGAWDAALSSPALLDEIYQILDLNEVSLFSQHAFVPSVKEDVVNQYVLKKWEHVYAQNEHHIDSMFRTLYRLIRWVDEQSVTFLDSHKKWHYISIVRAQVSRVEMAFLFYNGFTERGRKFNTYINKYAFFDNLDDNGDLGIRFMRQLKESPFEADAFNSDQARSALVKGVALQPTGQQPA